MKYKKTLQVLVICVVCELYALLFSALIYSCRGEGGRTEMRTEMKNAVVTGNNELFHHRGHRVSQSIPLFMRQAFYEAKHSVIQSVAKNLLSLYQAAY